MLRKIFIVICLCAISIITGNNISYTYESYTWYGKYCITDCIDGKCMALWNMYKSCTPGKKSAFKYYTTQERYQHRWCKSRCGIFMAIEPRHWCFISDTEWDYCNPEHKNEKTSNKAIAKSDGPCIDDCKFYGLLYLYQCKTRSAWSACEPHMYPDIIQAKTINDVRCVGFCGRYDGSLANYCITMNLNWARCAPPAQDYSLLRNLYGVNVSDHAKLLERPSSYNYSLTKEVKWSGISVYSYTILLPALKDDAALPVLVRARVTNKTLWFPKSSYTITVPDGMKEHVRRMGMNLGRKYGYDDESGCLIGNIIGGPDDFYNFVPQTQRLHRKGGSQWYRTEKYIRNFVHVTGGRAEMTILVVYNDLPDTTRPDGFGVNVALYYPNNTLHDECKNKYYSNDPDMRVL